MVDIMNFNTVKELKDYYEDLSKKINCLESIILNGVITPEQYFMYNSSLKEYQQELNELSKYLPKSGRYHLQLGLFGEYYNKSNKEWLDIILRLMNERGEKKYSVQFFNRYIPFFDYVAPFNEPQNMKNSNKTYTFVAIVADNFDINSVPNDELIHTKKLLDKNKESDFVIFGVVKQIEDKEVYLEEKGYFQKYAGMPRDVKDTIDEMAFQEYKNNHVVKEDRVKSNK